MERIILHMGEMGTYQRWLVVLMLPFGAAMAFNYCIQIFIAATPKEHWCRVPELENLTVELRRNLSIPFTDEPPGWDRCRMFAANYTEVLATLTRPANDTHLIPCRNGWEFLFNDIPYSTIINEREWVCERATNAPLAQSAYFAGSLVGVIIFGFLGDAYGRLPAFVGANIIGFIGSMATLFTVGEWDYALARFIAGLANDTCYVMIYIIVLEFIGSRHRSWVSNVAMGSSCAGAQILIPLLALWFKNWRTLLIVTSLPSLLALAMPWIVPESVRWLSTRGKINRALKILKRFERINKTKIPEDVLNEFIIKSNKTLESDQSLKAVLQSSKLRKCLIVLICVGIIAYISIDTIIRLSENIGYSLFVTFAASSFAELPALGFVAFTLDRFGRRPFIVATLAFTSVCAFTCSFMARDGFQAFFAVSVRFFVNMSLSVVFQLGPEILPTPARSSGNSLIHLTMLLGAVVSPYVVHSGTVWSSLPLVIVGAITVVGTLLSLLLPETTGRSIPQTLADGERLVAENMLCGRIEPDDEDLPRPNQKCLPETSAF
ncbi:beta-alanine transporter isoform X2 [Amyelois transitella]|nr:beta-alanine transporter isoform X2 [Amyelois transitella]